MCVKKSLPNQKLSYLPSNTRSEGILFGKKPHTNSCDRQAGPPPLEARGIFEWDYFRKKCIMGEKYLSSAKQWRSHTQYDSEEERISIELLNFRARGEVVLKRPMSDVHTHTYVLSTYHAYARVLTHWVVFLKMSNICH